MLDTLFIDSLMITDDPAQQPRAPHFNPEPSPRTTPRQHLTKRPREYCAMQGMGEREDSLQQRVSVNTKVGCTLELSAARPRMLDM